MDVDTAVPQTPEQRLRDLAARTASQCAAVELAAIGLAADTFGDQALNNLAATLAGASHRLSQIGERIVERLTPTTLEDTDDDRPDPHPYLGTYLGTRFGGF